MLRRAVIGGLALGCLVPAAQAAFVGTINFDGGTSGELNKEIQVSGAQTYNIGNFGGPGQSLNYDGSPPGGFKSEYLVVDTSGTGAGDVYGDVTIRALYRPGALNEGFEFAVAARVQELIPGGASNGTGSTGWGVWASAGTQAFAPGLNIAYEPSTDGQGNVRASQTLWGNGDTIVISSSTWYDVSFSVVGLTATATITELNASFAPVTGHTASVSHNALASEMALTGFVGTRGAQTGGSAGYLLDNVEVSLVPEPGSLGLLGLGAMGLIRRRRTV